MSFASKIFNNRGAGMDIKRDKYLADLINRMNNGMIKVVTGIRRCGKSYLIFTIFKNYLKEQGIDESHMASGRQLALKRFAVDFLQKGRPPKALKSAGFRAFGFLTVFFSADAAALCASNLHTNGFCPDNPSCFELLSHTGEREDFSRGSVRCFRIRFFR